MPYCPNPDCSHRRRQGSPAEYRAGVEICADCGTSLVAGEPTPPPKRSPAGWPAPLRRRLWITALLVVAAGLAQLVPSPFIDTRMAADLSSSSFFRTSLQLGPFSLGLMPVISGFVLVELLALLVPGWRNRRHQDPELRHRLSVASIALGLCLALVQGYLIALWVESLSYWKAGTWSAAADFAHDWGIFFRIQVAATFAAGTSLFVLAALAISRWGVGSGFVLIIAIELLTEGILFAANTWSLLAVGVIDAGRILTYLVGMAIMAALVVWVLTRPPRKPPGGLPVTMPTCGLLPLQLSFPFMLIPMQLSNLFHIPWLQALSDIAVPGTTHYLFIQLGVVLLFAPLASLLYWWRFRAHLRRGGHAMTWLRAQVYSAAFLVALVLAWHVLIRVAGSEFSPGPGILWIVILGAVAVDLWAEVGARRRAPGGRDLVPLSAHDHPATALMDLGKRPPETGAFAQALRFRSLHYFFTPYVPVRVLGSQPDATGDPH